MRRVMRVRSRAAFRSRFTPIIARANATAASRPKASVRVLAVNESREATPFHALSHAAVTPKPVTARPPDSRTIHRRIRTQRYSRSSSIQSIGKVVSSTLGSEFTRHTGGTKLVGGSTCCAATVEPQHRIAKNRMMRISASRMSNRRANDVPVERRSTQSSSVFPLRQVWWFGTAAFENGKPTENEWNPSRESSVTQNRASARTLVLLIWLWSCSGWREVDAAFERDFSASSERNGAKRRGASQLPKRQVFRRVSGSGESAHRLPSPGSRPSFRRRRGFA